MYGLVLSRKAKQSIMIALEGHEPITITLIELCGDKARLGIHAPPEFTIHRDEVWRKILAQQEEP
jgi:carbon storage regulator